MITVLSVCLAQPPDSGGFDDPDADAEIPIDGGVGILAAAGIAYGVKKVYKNRKKNSE